MIENPVSLTTQPEGYADWLAELKARILSAQQRATLAVNRESSILNEPGEASVIKRDLITAFLPGKVYPIDLTNEIHSRSR